MSFSRPGRAPSGEHGARRAQLTLCHHETGIDLFGCVALPAGDLKELGHLVLRAGEVLRQSKEPLGKGVLQWMHYEIYGEVVWQRGPWVGFQFDRHLEETVLLETRAAAPCLIKDQAKEIEHYAQEFVQGRPVSR